MTTSQRFINNATTEILRTRQRDLENELQQIREELTRRTNLQIEQLQAQIQRLATSTTTHTSSVVAENIAEEERIVDTRELNNNITQLIEDEDEEHSVVQFVDDQRIRVRRVATGVNTFVPILHPTNNEEGIISAAQNLREQFLSRRRLSYGTNTGLVDNENNNIVAGTIVQLLSRSSARSPFRHQTHAVVVGTAHNGRRVLLGLLTDREQTTDRDPNNILGPEHE